VAISTTNYGRPEPVAKLNPAFPDEENQKAFVVRALDEIEDGSHADIVQGLYGGSTVIAMVGSPGAGKTAIGIDHGAHLAAGELWFGLKVAGGPVVYFAAEAPASVIMRAKACVREKFPGRRLPFYVATGAPELGGETTSVLDAERVIATIREVESQEGTAVKLVQIDTLASCLGNGDENGDGMIRLVAAAKYVATTTAAAVMLIHHPSKGDANGMRGHGSLAGACDTIITIASDEVSGVRTATLVKSRDSATGLQFCYTLEKVTLPERDSFDDPRTTVIVRSTEVRQSRPRPKGKRQQALLAELERRHRTGETGWAEAEATAAARSLGMPPQSARDALKGLMHAGYVWGNPARLTLKYPPDEGTK
jgi:AAA domain-containing protein